MFIIQVPHANIVVFSTNLEGNVQFASLVGENTPKNKAYDKNYQFHVLWLPFLP